MPVSDMAGVAAIVGIGQTKFSKKSGRSELGLATEAVGAAIADARLTPADVDGLTSFTADTSPEIAVARSAGIGELTFMSRVGYGGGAAGAVVMQAAMAVATGVASTVVVYRAFNERSGRRFGDGQLHLQPAANAEQVAWGWVQPFGLLTPASWVAMAARRYMHEFGATSEDFGRISVLSRKHAATNPNAWFYGKPVTLQEHQASRLIVDPLRLLDCCQESDGGVALVVTSLDRARDLTDCPVVIKAAAQGAGRDQFSMTSFYRPNPEMAELPEMALVAQQLYRAADLTADDIRLAVIYDHFTPFVLEQLEAFDFCGRGEAKDFVAEGNLELGARLPVNPHGGQLGEAYIHGMNGVTEAVRQIRGTAANQVAAADNILVTAGTGVPTSGLILGSDRR